MNRPDTDAQDQLSKSSFSACNARPVHTDGPNSDIRVTNQDGALCLTSRFDICVKQRGGLKAAPSFTHSQFDTSALSLH